MLKRFVSLFLVIAFCLSPLMNVYAESQDDAESFNFNGAVWDMSKEEVRSLLGIEPYQESSDQSGHSGLMYLAQFENSMCILQYGFLPSDDLYNIVIVSPEDTDKIFYNLISEDFSSKYGEAMTIDEADLESTNAVAVMLALLQQSTTDTDFLGWQADDETVIILSFDPNLNVTYVEIRRYSDFFDLAPSAE